MPIITPVGAPALANSQTNQNDARARAIAKLTQAPVENPTQVSPEELSVVQPPESRQETINEEAATEVAAVEATKPKEEPLSSQYAQLARKEKAIRAKVQELKAKEAAIAAKDAEYAAKDSEYQSKYISRDALAQDPWSILQDLGITYDKLTEQALNTTQQDPQTKAYLTRLEAEIKALRSEQEGTKKTYQANQDQQYQQALNQIKAETQTLVASDPNFETIRETGSVDDVVELIKQTFDKDGILLTVEEAAQEVENHLVEEALKIARIKKIQQRLSPQQAQKQPETVQKQPAKTLTNAMATTKPMTAKQRAILAFEGKLK